MPPMRMPDRSTAVAYYARKLLECGVPGHIHHGIIGYIVDNYTIGNFLRAVFENDLVEAFGRADELNRISMGNIAAFIYNYAPSPCWGSKEAVKQWLSLAEVPSNADTH